MTYNVLDDTSSDQLVELWLQGTKIAQKLGQQCMDTSFSQVLTF